MSDAGQREQRAPDAGEGGEQPRRVLLGRLAAGAGAGAAALAVAPLAAAVLAPAASPELPAEAPFLDVADERDIPPEGALRVELRAARRDAWLAAEQDLGACWLARTPAGLRAFSAACPHLGCGVIRAPGGFLCPCHSSHFDALGGAKDGPSPRGLDPLPLRIERGRVLVQALRYAPGGKVRRAIE